MKKLQARLFIVFMAVLMIVSTSTLTSAAQHQSSAAPVPETSTQGVYPLLVIIIEIVCPLPFDWPVV